MPRPYRHGSPYCRQPSEHANSSETGMHSQQRNALRCAHGFPSHPCNPHCSTAPITQDADPSPPQITTRNTGCIAPNSFNACSGGVSARSTTFTRSRPLCGEGIEGHQVKCARLEAVHVIYQKRGRGYRGIRQCVGDQGVIMEVHTGHHIHWRPPQPQC